LPPREPQTLKQLRWLHDQYRKANRRFWGSQLPEDVRIVVVPAGRIGYSIDCRLRKSIGPEEGMTTTFLDDAGQHMSIPIIELNELIMSYPPYAKLVLIHEMCHVAGFYGHGKAFKAEVDRISKLGALKEILL
jgi:hypothetical protein